MQIGALAERAGVSEADLAFWRAQRDHDAPEHLVNHPDLFWCEGHFVTVGRRPTQAYDETEVQCRLWFRSYLKAVLNPEPC